MNLAVSRSEAEPPETYEQTARISREFGLQL